MTGEQIILARYSPAKTLAIFAIAGVFTAVFYMLPWMAGGLEAMVERPRYTKASMWPWLAPVIGPAYVGWLVLTLRNQARWKGLGVIVDNGQLRINGARPMSVAIGYITLVQKSAKYPFHIEIFDAHGRYHLKTLIMMNPGPTEIIDKISELVAIEAAKPPEHGPFTPASAFRDFGPVAGEPAAPRA